jgi:hypothetical protein
MWKQSNGTSMWACRTGVVDVLTSELLVAWPGMSVGASASGQSVWVFDGDAMKPMGLGGLVNGMSGRRPGWPLERGPEEVHIQTSTRTWGGWVVPRKPAPPIVKSYTLRVGDMIPRQYGADPRIVLVDILGARRAVFHIGSGYGVTLPGDRQRNLDF